MVTDVGENHHVTAHDKMPTGHSLQTSGCGFMGRGQELGEVTVGVRLVGQTTESGLHGSDPAGKRGRLGPLSLIGTDRTRCF